MGALLRQQGRLTGAVVSVSRDPAGELVIQFGQNWLGLDRLLVESEGRLIGENMMGVVG